MAAKPQSPTPTTAVATALAEFQDAMSRGQVQVQAMLETVSGESRRFFEGMTDDAAVAIEQFKTCQSPAEALTIEQAWLAKRAKAYMDCGLRIMQAMAPTAPAAAPPAPGKPSEPATAA